jgi:cytochrome c-type biogenesis protein CcmH/NrfG
MATTIGSLGEPSSSRRNPSHAEWIIRISQLQEILAIGPADIAARSELATLLEQLDQPEEALLNWNAILSCDPNNLHAREGVARCRRRMLWPLKSNRSNR